VMGARLIEVEGRIQSGPEKVVHLVADRLVDRSHDLKLLAGGKAGVASAPPWPNRSTTTAVATRSIRHKRSAIRAMCGSCRGRGIFIKP
jgi:hypothetical protein